MEREGVGGRGRRGERLLSSISEKSFPAIVDIIRGKKKKKKKKGKL